MREAVDMRCVGWDSSPSSESSSADSSSDEDELYEDEPDEDFGHLVDLLSAWSVAVEPSPSGVAADSYSGGLCAANRSARRLQACWRGRHIRRSMLRSNLCWARIRPSLLRRLKRHQVHGVRWLFGAWCRGGGILADDPGLGKTLQV